MAHCPQCGGPLTLIAAIEDPAVIAKIPTHLGLPTRDPMPSGSLPEPPLPLNQNLPHFPFAFHSRASRWASAN